MDRGRVKNESEKRTVYVWQSGLRKIDARANLEGKSFPRGNQNQGSSPGPVRSRRHICPLARPVNLDSVAIVRSDQRPRISLAARRSILFHVLVTSVNPLHKHCIVFRRGCSHYIIFCY